MKNILITGVSSGIGRVTCENLLEKGFIVFGSARKISSIKDLARKYGSNFIPLIFDITDKKAVMIAVKKVKNRLKNKNLDCLINNAGIVVGGPSILLQTEEFRKQFEVNFFGIITLTNALIKILGGDLKNPHKGKIINISSVSGKRALPFLAPYAASKFALEGYSDSLRRELMMYGIDVILIQPGPVKTPIWNKILSKKNNYFKISDYKNKLQIFRKISIDNKKSGIDSKVISNCIYKIIQSKKPKTRYLITRNYINYFLSRIIPDRILDRIIGKKLDLF